MGGTLGSTAEGHCGNAAAHGEERVHGTVASFREKAEGDAVGYNLVYHSHRFTVVGHFLRPLAVLSGKGDNLAEMQEACNHGIAEDIGPGTEGRALPAQLQYHQGVHKGVGVVAHNEPCAVVHGRQRTVGFNGRETPSGAPVYVAPPEVVGFVWNPEISHCVLIC